MDTERHRGTLRDTEGHRGGPSAAAPQGNQRMEEEEEGDEDLQGPMGVLFCHPPQ